MAGLEPAVRRLLPGQPPPAARVSRTGSHETSTGGGLHGAAGPTAHAHHQDPMAYERHHDAYAFLPRFARLQHLGTTLSILHGPELSAEQREAMDSALRKCAELTIVTLDLTDFSLDGPSQEHAGARLMRSLTLPRLRSLTLIDVHLESLRFLQHAPQLEELEFEYCEQISMSPVHLALLGLVVLRLTPSARRQLGAAGRCMAAHVADPAQPPAPAAAKV